MNGTRITRILTWNIGSFSFLKYAPLFNLYYKKQKISHEYFQPKLNSSFVSAYIQKINPDILCLQEIHTEDDVSTIKALIAYPYKTLISTWYHKHSILIASKSAFTLRNIGEFSILNFEDMYLIPIHLNSFEASLRLKDTLFLKELTTTLKKVIILGDTNFWKIKNFFFFKKDREAYNLLTKSLSDLSKQSGSTSVIGLEFDKIFGSKNIKIQSVTCEKTRGPFMDHYPLYINIL